VAASDEVVFAWAIGKALLIVIVCVGTLIYAAWAVPGTKPQAGPDSTRGSKPELVDRRENRKDLYEKYKKASPK
jgi:hypothetical protein